MNDTLYSEPLTDADFTELLIRHMILMPEVNSKAKHLKLVGDDMMLDDTYGNDLYKELINLINGVDVRPIPAATLLDGLKRRFDDGILDNGMKENTLEFIEYVYDENRLLEPPEFFDNKISTFLKKRRAQKIIAQYKDDITTLTSELNKLNLDLVGDSSMSKPRIISPFSDIIYKTKTNMVGSGLSKLDEKLDGGLLLGEFALLIGFSGGGKTAVGTNMVGISAEMGRPSTYISCEEHEDMLSQRLYSRVFRIPYRQLRQGVANIQLESRFNEEMTTQKIKSLEENLCLMGLKGIDSPITPNLLYQLLLQYYEETGFVPQQVMLDQMQFVSPDTTPRKNMAGWEIEGMVAAELDQLSHRQIGGKNFVLWVQHQAKGKTKAYFTKDDIQGYKAVDNKADLVLGVGRLNEKADEINLFPLKVRHSAQFKITLKTEFEFMTVTSTQVSDTLGDQNTDTENPTMTTISHAPIPTNPFN